MGRSTVKVTWVGQKTIDKPKWPRQLFSKSNVKKSTFSHAEAQSVTKMDKCPWGVNSLIEIDKSSSFFGSYSRFDFLFILGLRVIVRLPLWVTIYPHSFRAMARGWTPAVVPQPEWKKSFDSFVDPRNFWCRSFSCLCYKNDCET